MLCTTLRNPDRLGDPRYVAEPKFDGRGRKSTWRAGEQRQSSAAQGGRSLAFVAFDLLQLDGRDVMGEPWADRRKRLEDLGAALTIPNVTIVPEGIG